MRYLIVVLCSVCLYGCANWNWEYDPIEDEIIIETTEEKDEILTD